MQACKQTSRLYDLLHQSDQSHPKHVFPDIQRLWFNKSASLCKLLLEPKIASEFPYCGINKHRFIILNLTESLFCFKFKQ